MRGNTFRAPKPRRAGGRPFGAMSKKRARPDSRLLSVNSARFSGMKMLKHELRTPLTGILGMAGLLKEFGLADEQRHYLLAMQESGLQMKCLIERMTREFPALFRNRLTQRPSVNGLRLLQVLVRSHWPAAMGKDIRLYLAFDHHLPECWHCDPAQLRQLLDNLLVNAVKFTHQGHVLVDARSAGVNQNGKLDIELVVRDTGIGIADADARRIYSVRDQGSGNVYQRYGGSGLGLFVCKRIVASLGGSLHHRQNSLGGSSFQLILPGMANPDSALASRLRPALFAGLRCQLAPGKPVSRVVKQVLKRAGVQVSRLRDEKFRHMPDGCDAVICDASQVGDGILNPPSAAGRHDPVLISPYLQLPASTGDCERGASMVSLPQPILQSNLEPLFLQLALQRKLQGTSG